jgi:hypothetical protein
VTEFRVEVLYGSRARGDADESSDVDVLVLSDHDRDGRVESPVARGCDPAKLAVTHYRWNEFDGMHSYGSLFLHHLRKEGVVTAGTAGGRARYSSMMRRLPSYARSTEDVRSFSLALDDVEDAIAHRDSTPLLELSSLATVFRHSSILGCYAAGSPTFGRHQSVPTFGRLARLPEPIWRDFASLYAYRLAVARNLESPAPASYDLARTWLARARVFVQEVRTWTASTSVSVA